MLHVFVLLNLLEQAQDRGQKLWDTYVKYLLSYETLSKDEKETLEKQVIAEWNRKKKVKDDCMIKVGFEKFQLLNVIN